MATTNNISIMNFFIVCLLNGDVGGSLPASIDFGTMDIVKDIYTEYKIEDFSKYKFAIIHKTESVIESGLTLRAANTKAARFLVCRQHR